MPKKYPDITVKLSDEDGNAHAIMGRVVGALRKGGVSKAEIHKYLKEAQSGDYGNLLRVTMHWVYTY